MATKKKTTHKTAKKATKKVDSREQFLLTLIEYSERADAGQGTSIDDLFQQQAARLKRELAEYKASK